MEFEPRLQPANLDTSPTIPAVEEPLHEPEVLESQDAYLGPDGLGDWRFLDDVFLADGEEPVQVTAPTVAMAAPYPLIDFKTNPILSFPINETENIGFKIMSEKPKAAVTNFTQTDLVLPLNITATYLTTPDIFIPGNQIDISGKAYDIATSTQNVTLYTGEVLICEALTLTNPESATAYVLLIGPKTASNETNPFTRKVICLEVDRSTRKPNVTAAVDYEERLRDPEGISHALILSGKSSRYENQLASRILYVRQPLTIDVDIWSDYRNYLSEVEQGCLDVLLSWHDSQNATLFKQAENTSTDIDILDEKYTTMLEQHVELGTDVSVKTYHLANDNRSYRLIFLDDGKKMILDCVAFDPSSKKELGGLRHSIGDETIQPITTPSAVWDVLTAWESITNPDSAAILTIGNVRYVVSKDDPVETNDDEAAETVTTTAYRLTSMAADKTKYQLTDTRQVGTSAGDKPRHTVDCVALGDAELSIGGLRYSTETATITFIPSATTQKTDEPQKLKLDQVNNKIQFAVEKTAQEQGEVHWLTYAFPETLANGVDSNTGFSNPRNTFPQPGLVLGWRQLKNRKGPYLKDYNSYLSASDALAQVKTQTESKPARAAKVRTPSNNWGVSVSGGLGGGNSQFTHAKNNDTKGLTETVDAGLFRDFSNIGGSRFGFRIKLNLNATGTQQHSDNILSSSWTPTETAQSPSFATWSSQQLFGGEVLMDTWSFRVGIGGLAGVTEYFFTTDSSMVLAGTDTVPLDYVRFMPHPVVGGEAFIYVPQNWMPDENLFLLGGYRLVHSWQGDAIGQVRDHTVDGIEKDIVRTDHFGFLGLEYRF